MSYERVIRIWKGLDLRYAEGKALEENFAVLAPSETFILGARGFDLFRVLTGYLFRVSVGICSGY